MGSNPGWIILEKLFKLFSKLSLSLSPLSFFLSFSLSLSPPLSLSFLPPSLLV